MLNIHFKCAKFLCILPSYHKGLKKFTANRVYVLSIAIFYFIYLFMIFYRYAKNKSSHNPMVFLVDSYQFVIDVILILGPGTWNFNNIAKLFKSINEFDILLKTNIKPNIKFKKPTQIINLIMFFSLGLMTVYWYLIYFYFLRFPPFFQLPFWKEIFKAFYNLYLMYFLKTILNEIENRIKRINKKIQEILYSATLNLTVKKVQTLIDLDNLKQVIIVNFNSTFGLHLFQVITFSMFISFMKLYFALVRNMKIRSLDGLLYPTIWFILILVSNCIKIVNKLLSVSSE